MSVNTNLQNELLTISKKLSYGTTKIKCPSCSQTRKKHKHDRPLSLTVSSECVLYRCHHCGIEGRVSETDHKNKIFYNCIYIGIKCSC